MLYLHKRAALLLAGLLLMGAAPLAAQMVTLKSADGSVALAGKLLGYDGEFYRLDTVFGEMTLRGLGVVCAGHGCPDPAQYAADITISGDSDVVNKLLPSLVEDFAFSTGTTSLRSNHGNRGWTYFVSDAATIPIARIQAQPGDSKSGLQDLTSNISDLAVTTRAATFAEAKRAKNSGIGDLNSPDQRQILALDALVFIVSQDNPVSSLSLEDIRKIYSGDITNWSALGGIDAPITRYRRGGTSDIGRAFSRMVLLPDFSPAPKTASILADAQALSDAVAADPLAIGFTRFSGIRNAKALAIRGACGVRQIPDRFGLQSGDYPLSRYIYLYQPKAKLPVFARDFLAYLAGPQGQKAVSDLGYVGQELAAKPFAMQQERIANAVRLANADVSLEALKGFVNKFSDASRLAATFRFQDKSTKLNVRSRHSLKTLIGLIETGDFNGRELIFAGFSDSQGGGAGNRRIARQRAEQVAKLVRSGATRADLSKIKFQIAGLGEVSPIACNGTENGRLLNRRVEVWVR
jgi:phosphate transport system substrate-binding protein